MKPRPLMTTCLKPTTTGLTRINFQTHCRLFDRSTPTIAVALQYRQWHSNNYKRHLIASSILSTSYRSASTSTAAARKQLPPSTRVPVPSTARTPQLEQNPKLNPPTTSYAPELALPPRGASQSYISYLWKCGRTYIAFYKAGISNVRSTAKLAKTLRAKAGDKPREEILTRAEWQLVRRSRKDMMRLPAFGLLVLLMGEWVPLIALYVTPLIPEPCRIPAQVTRDVRKAEERRVARANKLMIEAARIVHRDRVPGASLKVQGQGMSRALGVETVDQMDTLTLLNHAARLDAYSKIWDWLPISPPRAVVAWGLKKKLSYLRKDDELIIRDGGWQGLGPLEVRKVCFERGIEALEVGEREMRMQLAKWYGPEGRGMARRTV